MAKTKSPFTKKQFVWISVGLTLVISVLFGIIGYIACPNFGGFMAGAILFLILTPIGSYFFGRTRIFKKAQTKKTK